MLFRSGDSGESVRDKVTENFDARAYHKKNDYRILISTEVLSEGVNLHRANVVINYDIPWNPTKMMQRVGRINRVDTPFDVIHTFNFFPTKQSNDQIKLKEAAEAKINAFLTLLGGDAELLTEGEPVGSHELFDRLISKKTLEGDDETEESELKYLQVIQDIRENDPNLFEKIKHLPKKARTAKTAPPLQSLQSFQSNSGFHSNSGFQPEIGQPEINHRQDACDTMQPETNPHSNLVSHSNSGFQPEIIPPEINHRQDACDTIQPETNPHSSLVSHSNSGFQPEIGRRLSACDTIQPEIISPEIYFDPYNSVEIKQRDLPHWQQNLAVYFVTFRLYDSRSEEHTSELQSH